MNQKTLASFGSVPVTFGELAPLLNGYHAPKNKVQDMERKGLLVRIKKGLYVASSEATGQRLVPELIANRLHGPSYVSRHSALRFYGLIPERVVCTQSMTMGRTIEYDTPVGRFSYIHVSPDYYAIGIAPRTEDGVSFIIALPEKALCDIIVSTPALRLRSLKMLRTWLEEDIRMDMDGFRAMNPAIFEACAPFAKKSQTIVNLAKIIRHDNI